MRGVQRRTQVVVGDQMQCPVLKCLAVDLLEEFQPLDVCVVLLALPDDLAVQHVKRGEQRGGAIALVVVCHGGRASLLQRQPGLRTIQCLHLALFVAAQYQRMLGRRHIETDDVFERLDKPWVARHLERLDQVGLKAIGLPDLEYRRIRNAELVCQLARAPMRGAFGKTIAPRNDLTPANFKPSATPSLLVLRYARQASAISLGAPVQRCSSVKLIGCPDSSFAPQKGYEYDKRTFIWFKQFESNTLVLIHIAGYGAHLLFSGDVHAPHAHGHG